MDCDNTEQLSLRFVDEETVKLLPKPTINNYSRMPNNVINYADIFDNDQSLNMSQSQTSNFFGQNSFTTKKDQRQELTLYLRQSLGNLKARKKTVHHIPPLQYMRTVQNVTLPANYSELLQIFLSSNYFLYFIRFIVLLNLVAIFLIDYSFRIAPIPPIRLSTLNTVSLCLQLFTNCVFTIEILMKYYQHEPNLHDPYLIMNIVGTLATWITIFFDMVQYDSNSMFQIFMIIRIVRAIIRIMQVFESVRNPFEVFVSTIPSLQRLFFPFVIITLFYALTGMALYSGSTNFLCRELVNNNYVYKGYCGSSMYTCPTNQQCVEVTSEPPPQNWNQYNLINFNTIYNALLTVHHFVYNTNFTLIRGKFTFFINPFVSSLFFVSMSIFFYYIFSNLIMLSMSKSYMEQLQNKQREKRPNKNKAPPPEKQEEPTTGVKALQIMNFILIVAQSIVISLTYTGMTEELRNLQSLLDFVLSFVSLAIIIVLIVLEKQQYFKQPLNLADFVTIALHMVDLIICAILKESVIYSQTNSTLVLRSLKIIRLMRALYISDKIFKYEKEVIQIFTKTILKIKSFLLLCLCFAIMFKQIAELLFAFRVRFNTNGQVDLHGEPFINNFESFSASLFSILYLFLNQNWTSFMYKYYAAVGWQAVFFFVIVSFIAYMMLSRLYIAVFLSYFREELAKKSKQELIRENNQKLENLREKMRKNPRQMVQKTIMETTNTQDGQIARQIGESGCCSLPVLKSIFHSNKFNYFINIVIFLHCLTIVVRSSDDSSSKEQLLQAFEYIVFSVYIMEVILGCLIDGIYFPPESFLKKNKSNVISLGVAVLSILAFVPFSNNLVNAYISRLTIIKIFTLFRDTDKNMTIVLDTIGQIIQKFFKFLLIYILLLYLLAIIPLKLLNNQSNYFSCHFTTGINQIVPTNQTDCLAQGGYWFQYQNFNNIFSSIALLYQLMSTESWSVKVNAMIREKTFFGWQLFFIVFFFVYNILFLNIMMGFIVETYMHLKDKAYNLNLLKQSQKCWILIKNSINCLVPKPVITIPAHSSSQRRFLFELTNSEGYLSLLDYMAYFNAFLYLISFQGASGFYLLVINYGKNGMMFIFVADVILKIIAFRRKYIDLCHSIVEFICGAYIIVYALILWNWKISSQLRHILEFLLVLFMLLRCKSLLLKYSWCKTNLNSVIDILPKCGTIIKLVCALLFVYAAIGMELFKDVKKDNVIDNYNIGYNNFLTAILTLVRVSVAQAWYEVISAFLKYSTPVDVCYNISDHLDANTYAGNGCGSWVAWPYFLSFHLAMVLLVMNLLIATMASAYDDNYEIQYNSVNIFQLQDCLSRWQKYDPHATGVVHYKKFWRLTSQIAILFGISKKKLIKRKNKFFEELDLQLYQEKMNPILCYRFHDVITKFSKIKLQVANLGSKNQEDSQVDIEFDISPVIMKQIKDYVTPFPEQLYTNYEPFKQYKSGETKYIFGLLKKLRQWKHVSTEKKRIAGGNKLSSIFDIKSRKLANNQNDARDSLIPPDF